jgi:hypothetical protein
VGASGAAVPDAGIKGGKINILNDKKNFCAQQIIDY